MTHDQQFCSTQSDTPLQDPVALLLLSPPSRVLRGAACAKPGVNPDDFFPPVDSQGRRDPTRKEQTAKRFCVACPVRRSCLVAALQRREPYGIFGGLTASERNRLREVQPTDLPRDGADSDPS